MATFRFKGRKSYVIYFANDKMPKTIEYWRKPTKEEIKFGYGANHYRDFDIENCFDKDGYLIKLIFAKDDTLKYHRC